MHFHSSHIATGFICAMWTLPNVAFMPVLIRTEMKWNVNNENVWCVPMCTALRLKIYILSQFPITKPKFNTGSGYWWDEEKNKNDSNNWKHKRSEWQLL